jgi:endothelin-converting enzyme/putative endopeptidase
MSAETKWKRLKNWIRSIKIGYPDKWKDYSKLDIKVLSGGSYFENMKNLSRWNFKRYRQAWQTSW